jgi:H+/Cl- antiporter ClcA/CBS domain-containing protein
MAEDQTNGEHRQTLEKSSTTRKGLPVSPSLGPTLEAAQVPARARMVDKRVIYLSVLAIITGILASLMAEVLIWFIRFITKHSFPGLFPDKGINYVITSVPWWVIFVPAIGGIVIGLIARFGSRAIAGHGIPETMEQVLTNQSRIAPKLTFLKPFSAAISIGTGAPYGAEGPIIASGGAMGSLLGQLLAVTAWERKVLLAAGASAGIAFAFNAPIASVLLAVELFLFEFRPRSLIPVGLACVVGGAMHMKFEGTESFFTFGHFIAEPTLWSSSLYLIMGCIIGVGSVILTRAVYMIEHFFEHLPIHWIWHPAIGGLVVGLIGYFAPRTFGSGYYNINDLLGGHLALAAIAFLGIMKFLSWTISLGSGTAGGTLAPVFTIGGTLGAVLGIATVHFFPHSGVDVGVAAMVGMVGIFAGASRALLTSTIFAIETTMEPHAIIPSLVGCTAAYLVSSLMMRHSIMTEKMARQGVSIPQGYAADFLDLLRVGDVMARGVTFLKASQTLATAREFLQGNTPEASHQGYPIQDDSGFLVGVLTRRNLLDPKEPPETTLGDMIRRFPSIVYDDCTLREAADHMVNHEVGRLPVVARNNPSQVVGMITRSDLLSAHRKRIKESSEAHATLRLRDLLHRNRGDSSDISADDSADDDELPRQEEKLTKV